MNDPVKAKMPTLQGPQTLEDFMAQALVMEREAVERYTEFADALEMHNNSEVAKLFRIEPRLRDKLVAIKCPEPLGGRGWMLVLMTYR